MKTIYDADAIHKVQTEHMNKLDEYVELLGNIKENDLVFDISNENGQVIVTYDDVINQLQPRESDFITITSTYLLSGDPCGEEWSIELNSLLQINDFLRKFI